MQNPTNVDAVVQVGVNPPDQSKCYVIPANTLKKIKYLYRTSQREVFLTMGSVYNIPNRISFAKQRVVPRSEDVQEGLFDYNGAEESVRNEVIVDNEDDGFELIVPSYARLADKWKKESSNLLYNARRWAKHYGDLFFGESVRSGLYKMGGKGNYKASWKVERLPRGTYDVFVKIPRLGYGFGGWQTTTIEKDYVLKYSVTEGDKERQVILNMQQAQRDKEGWYCLGRFQLGGDAKVTLSDEGKESQIIIADAVKWVKVD